MKSALIGVFIQTKTGFSNILKTLEDLGPDPRPMSSSMIYKRSHEKFEIEISADLVLKVRTSLTAEALNLFFKDYEKFCFARTQQKLKFKILSFEAEAYATPELTIPWPELSDDLLILKCAAEVSPDYKHPLLEKSLLELLQDKKIKPDFEFLSQGPRIKYLE